MNMKVYDQSGKTFTTFKLSVEKGKRNERNKHNLRITERVNSSIIYSFNTDCEKMLTGISTAAISDA